MFEWLVVPFYSLYPLTLVGEVCMTLLSAASVVIGLHTATMTKGAVICDKHIIRRRYLNSTHAFIDIVSGVPFDLVCYAAGSGKGYAWCYHLRLLRLAKVPSLFNASNTRQITPCYVAI
eukprot:gene2478-65294_t